MVKEEVENASFHRQQSVIPSDRNESRECFNDFYDDMELEENNSGRTEECSGFIREQELEIEIIAFTKLIGHNEFSQSVKGSNRFWKKNELEFPRLFLLWQVLSNNGCTSAHIERYFNITGLVCDKSRLNMTDDLIIERSMLKVNMPLLRQLKNTSK